MIQLTVGDTFEIPSATAFDVEDGDLTESIEFDDGGLNLSLEGTYVLTWVVYDNDGNEGIKALTIIVKTETGGGTEFTGYYASLSGLSGRALVDELYRILNDTGQYPTTTYGEARYYLQETDRWVTYNSDYLYLIYTDTLRKPKGSEFQFDGYALPIWDANNDGAKSTWNREHVWAKSLFGEGNYDPSNSTRGIDADLHNLRAADTNVNSTRGNNLFINQVYVAEGFGKYGSKWYPGDHHRGDVARIIFYMDIRWGELTNISKIGDLQTFIEWHKADPVDEFEIYRNNKIYKYQHNRNPFIDHPELVDMIYGN